MIMKCKKLFVGLLSASVLSLSMGTGFSAQLTGEEVFTPREYHQNDQIIPISSQLNEKEQVNFASITGTIKKISPMVNIDGAKLVMIEGEAGEITNFVVSRSTHILGQGQLEIGSMITGLYNINNPAILIYPPQYHADVLIVNDQHQNAQTNPETVMVLLIDEDLAIIVVNNQVIKAPKAYTDDQGVVMVPLRAIVEALGFSVTWNEQTKSIMVGKGISSLTIGKDYYTYVKTAPIQLGTAPTIMDQSTFVPLSFFTEVLKINKADVFEGQIVIDDGSIME